MTANSKLNQFDVGTFDIDRFIKLAKETLDTRNDVRAVRDHWMMSFHVTMHILLEMGIEHRSALCPQAGPNIYDMLREIGVIIETADGYGDDYYYLAPQYR